MIMIVSENTDGSTTHVMQWLKKQGYQNRVVRLNIEDKVFLDELNILDNKVVIETNNRKIDLTNDVSVIWFRRGNITLTLRGDKKKRKKLKLFTNEKSNAEIRNHLMEESVDLIKAVNNPKTKLIGGFGKGSVNKIEMLNIAQEVGFDIPDTAIVDTKSKLQAFYDRNNGKIITKGISDTLSFENDHIGYVVYTNMVTQEKIDELPETFFPSLFQGNIEKEIELRVFYWCGIAYAMAIFSQLDQQTNTDFRIYNKEKPNRMIAYKLPDEVVEKTQRFMNKVGLETGSLDLILDRHGRYVFLEVNPVGQFGMVSHPCNYMVEKAIAETLIQYENEFKKN